MFDFTKVREGVEDYLGEFVGDYDVESITGDLCAYANIHGVDINSIDDFDQYVFLTIVERHELIEE